MRASRAVQALMTVREAFTEVAPNDSHESSARDDVKNT